jgi:poly-gamma-glutamate synthesis protein (capsule biosynthesis protein)
MRYYFLVLLVTTVSLASAQDTTRLSLLFAGDVMGHDSQIASAFDASSKSFDYTSCFAGIKPYIEAADLAIANLEVTLAGRPYTGYPQFSSPDALAIALKEAGFDALVTANNHCVDRGKGGLERTIAMLDSFNIPHTGTFVDTVSRMNDSPLLLEKNGFKIALLNYTYGTNGIPVPKGSIVNLLDTAIMRKDIQKAKEITPDLIIVFTHWGLEYQSLPNKNQKDITELCFRLGVDLVIGAHPHVIQPMEWRKDSDQFVAYSLGNFVSGQRKRYTDGGCMAYIELEKIQFTQDSSATTIDSAGYYLQWVYRTPDKNKDYYIVSAHDVENDSVTIVKDASSKGLFKVFVDDSRLLYKKYNKNVPEMKALPRTFARRPDEQ